MQPIPLILIGGFLGAGKTTLVAAAAKRLAAQGKRVGLITNDQAGNLVDTAVLQDAGAPVCEVSGGCFCCRFEDLVGAMDKLIQQQNPDVLIGEPVGSCTDLSATVLQPMKDLYRPRFRVAPFSVLVDVKQVRTLERLRAALHGQDAARFPDNVMYIYQKQLEEADLIVLNKADLLAPADLAAVEETLRREFAKAPVVTISARDGTGVDAWLEFIMGNQPAGRTVTEVDYDEYAAGEAALGWLNAAARLEAQASPDWTAFCRDLIGSLQAEFRGRAAEVAHLKLHLATGNGVLAANLTGNGEQASFRGAIDGTARQAKLLLNVRAHIAPEPLRQVVQQAWQVAAGHGIAVAVEEMECFSPARPEPKHRYPSVV